MLQAHCLLDTLYAIADSHYWNMAKLEAWADSIITQVALPKPWLTALSLAQTQEQARAAILLELAGVGDVTHQLTIGFYYLQYLDNPELEHHARHQIFSMYDACFQIEKPELHTLENRHDAALSQAALNELLSPTLVQREYRHFSF